VGKYYVTTPIYYVNDVPHIGTAYPTVAADVVARFHRMMGDMVRMSTGTDENATKVARVALARGEEPKAFVDGMAAAFQDTWRRMNIQYDDFIRTTEPRQHRSVQRFIETLYERGDVYYAEYEGWYCIPCETHYLEGQLTEGTCPECGRGVEWMKEPGYFFRLSKYTQPLLDYIAAHPDWLQPEFRKNEVISFLKGGLRDVNITRKSDWGIPVPASLPNAEGLVIYVWYDALINYVTSAGFPDDEASFAQWWPADAHIVGKDIFTRFHATLWPAMLMGVGLPLPETVVAHGYWTIGGEKISKSKHGGKGFRINPLDLAQELVDASGCTFDIAVDALRYFLLREMPFGADGDFSLEAVYRRYNSDLGNDLGNLVNRTVTMIDRYCGGAIPAVAEILPEARHAAVLVETHLSGRVVNYMEALKAVWELISFLNRYIEEKKPWKLYGYTIGKCDPVEAMRLTADEYKAIKEDAEIELPNVLYTLAEGIRHIAVMLYPFMPSTAQQIAFQIGWNKPEWKWDKLDWGLLKKGSPIQLLGPIFPRFVDIGAPTVETTPTPAPAPEPAPAPAAPETPPITIDDFAKVQLKAGTIIAAEKHPKADKLLKLQVDLGEETPRQIIAGIAAVYAPEALVGRQIIVVANLQPAKLRGEVSQGMLLAASDGDGIAVLSPDKPVPNGSKVR
jgi:methionyl-tRNA synthetase